VSKPPEESSLSTGGGGGGGAAPGAGGTNVHEVVTKIYRPPGSGVRPGSLIMEVAGRPLFVLPGTVPAYRDMAPGESGTDIAQLQQGLQALGFGVGGDPGGVYGAGTAAAVAAFYHSIGYTVPKVTAGPKAARGAEVPLAEIMFVRRFPARVAALGGKIGSVVSGPLVTLSLGRPSIHGQLNPAYGALVRPGMRVTITVQGTGATAHGTVVSVSRRPHTKKSITGGLYFPMLVRPHGHLPGSMGPGQDVTLSINAAKTSAPDLAVPEAALFGGENGKVYVSKVTGPSSAVRVQVRVLTEGDGLVGVAPVTAGALRAGDQVVTGMNYLTSPGGKPGRARPAQQSGGGIFVGGSSGGSGGSG
jgi:peptidoglycan hydrolase-like protein with peptidoglycan-binding domain